MGGGLSGRYRQTALGDLRDSPGRRRWRGAIKTLGAIADELTEDSEYLFGDGIVRVRHGKDLTRDSSAAATGIEAELETMARLGIEASMQPNFTGNWGQAGGLYEQRLGEERTARMNPMSRVLAAGVRFRDEFKGRRVEELEETARRIAEEVRRDGREQLLPAMTPIERRIVHLALRDDGEVTTESRGEGFYKRVAIVRRPPQQEQSSSAP